MENVHPADLLSPSAAAPLQCARSGPAGEAQPFSFLPLQGAASRISHLGGAPDSPSRRL